MKNSFIFYSSFDEALRELPDKSRLKIYDAITDYALRGIDAQFTGVEKAVFSLIKPQLQANNQRYENGKKGGAPKGNSNAKKTTEKTTEKQPTVDFVEEEKTTKKQPNENENVNVNVIPPFYSPHRVEKQKNYEELFFEKYPKYAKDRAKARKDFDYKRLIEEFEKSSYLRSLYTLKQVNDNYALIVTGEFRDKEPKKDEFVEAANARADRERWYAMRRALSEEKSDRIKSEMMKDRKYFELNGRLGDLDIAIARAEIDEDERREAQLRAEREDLLEARVEILKKHKYTEEDLLPNYFCDKCKDTGWQEDGKACDCYLKS